MASSFRGLVYYHHGATWWHTGRHGAGEGTDSSESWATVSRRLCTTLGKAWSYETSKSSPRETHFPQEGHSYYNKDTPPKSATPYGPSIPTGVCGGHLCSHHHRVCSYVHMQRLKEDAECPLLLPALFLSDRIFHWTRCSQFLVGWQVSKLLSSACLLCPVLGLQEWGSCPHILLEFWRFKPRSSWFCSKYSFPLRHLPSLWSLLFSFSFCGEIFIIHLVLCFTV